MARWRTFTIRINKDDLQRIEFLAGKLQRSKSDAIRIVIQVAANQLLLGSTEFNKIESQLNLSTEDLAPKT